MKIGKELDTVKMESLKTPKSKEKPEKPEKPVVVEERELVHAT